MQRSQTMRISGFTRIATGTALLAVMLFSQGCAATVGRLHRTPPQNEDLVAAESLFKAGDYERAMLACVDIAKRRPDLPGLTDLQRRIMKRLSELREEKAKELSSSSDRRAIADADDRRLLPGTYGLTRLVHGETTPLKSLPGAMEKVLRRPVKLLNGVFDLNRFIEELGKSENVNIIADGSLSASEGAEFSISAKNVPLIEVLDYVSRNLNVTFYAGENIIWATASAQSETGAPLETRIYRLRKGVSTREIEEGTDIEGTIDAFLPKVASASVKFVPKSHLLIARNTRENLRMIESFLEELDVSPRQVLIEARFFEVGKDSYHDLGVDWIINSPVGITTKEVVQNGSVVRANKTEIESGATLKNVSRTGEAMSDGLSFAYRGVLTDPMFRAVVSALETSGKARSLAAPRVTAMNNTVATIANNLTEYYIKKYDTQFTIISNLTFNTTTPDVQTVESGITLEVTPSVGADNRTVSVRVVPSVTERIRWDEFTYISNGETMPVKFPVVATREIQTEVMVQSGETVVLGGLIQSKEQKNTRGTPILSSIPLFGRLFRYDSSNQEQRNLLIFVTATILSDRGEGLIPEDVSPDTAEGAVSPAAAPSDDKK